MKSTGSVYFGVIVEQSQSRERTHHGSFRDKNSMNALGMDFVLVQRYNLVKLVYLRHVFMIISSHGTLLPGNKPSISENSTFLMAANSS
jgi:hypothetical protein